MIDMLCKKVNSGDLCIDLASRYLEQHEWGLAKKAIEEGFAKGHLSNPNQAAKLLREIHDRLGIGSRNAAPPVKAATGSPDRGADG